MLGEWLPNLAIGWGVQWLGVLSPGPGVALILGVATSKGRAAALTSCLGIAAGAFVLASIAVMGLAALLADIVWAMTLVKFAGAAFLLYLAANAFRRMRDGAEVPTAKPVSSLKGNAALAGLAMQITNPKAILYWIAAASVAGLQDAPAFIIGLFLIGGAVNSFLGHGVWAVALSSTPFLTLYRSARRWIEGLLGGFFVFTAYKLATSR